VLEKSMIYILNRTVVRVLAEGILKYKEIACPIFNKKQALV